MWKPMTTFVSKLVSGWWTGGNAADGQEPPGAIPVTGLERKQEMLAHMVRLLARGKSSALFVVGDGGVGKSRTIRQTLESEGIKPVLLNSHVTPMALYRTLYENRDGKVVWLDDADSIYADMRVLGLLRSATWNDGERIVTYTSSQLTDIPSRFAFDGRIVFCATASRDGTRRSGRWSSRCDIYTLQATSEEMLEQMALFGRRRLRVAYSSAVPGSGDVHRGGGRFAAGFHAAVRAEPEEAGVRPPGRRGLATAGADAAGRDRLCDGHGTASRRGGRDGQPPASHDGILHCRRAAGGMVPGGTPVEGDFLSSEEDVGDGQACD